MSYAHYSDYELAILYALKRRAAVQDMDVERAAGHYAHLHAITADLRARGVKSVSALGAITYA